MDEAWDAHAATAAPAAVPRAVAPPATSARPAPAAAAAKPVGPERAAVGAPAPFRLGYRPELDGLRGIAVAVVVVHHVTQVAWHDAGDWLVPGGQVGLDIFFALSGFLITALLLGEFERTGRVDVVGFVRRRALRLLPALLVMLAGLFLVSAVGDRYSPGLLLSSAGWVATFSTNLAVQRPIVELIHTWSLSVEAHFYLLWCVTTALVVGRVRRPYPVLAGIAAGVGLVVAVARALLFHDGADVMTLYVGTLHRIDAPLVGALAGVAVVAGWLDGVPRRWAAWAGAAALAALAVAALRTTPISPVLFQGLYTVTPACGAVLVAAVPLAGDGRLRRAVSSRPLVALGAISYSVYLWHLPLVMWFQRNVPGWPVGARLAVCVAGSLAVGAASYHLVERPALRRKRASA